MPYNNEIKCNYVSSRNEHIKAYILQIVKRNELDVF